MWWCVTFQGNQDRARTVVFSIRCLRWLKTNPNEREKINNAFKKHHPYMKPPYIHNVYGSTEMGACLFRSPWTKDQELLAKTVGKPPVNMPYRIRHMTVDRLCQPEEEGEIEVLSPLRMENYWHNRKEDPIGWVGYLRQEKIEILRHISDENG